MYTRIWNVSGIISTRRVRHVCLWDDIAVSYDDILCYNAGNTHWDSTGIFHAEQIMWLTVFDQTATGNIAAKFVRLNVEAFYPPLRTSCL